MYATSVIALILVSVHITTQADIEGARRTLEATKADAERHLRNALAEADGSVLTQPLSDLKDMYEAGYDDLSYVESFEGPGDKEAALSASIDFWRRKMNEVIQPYISNPNSFKGLVMSDETPPKDPDWNNTNSYKKTEEEIARQVDEAIALLRKEFEELLKNKTSKLEEVTRFSWRRAGYGWALRAAVNSIRRQGQLSKHDAANGNTEKGMSWLKRVIDSSLAHFKSNIQDINQNSEITYT